MQEIKILVVDDEDLICKNVCSKIARLNHNFKYTTFISHSAENAFVMYEKIKPDVIITDINMAYQDGLFLVKKIREMDSEIKLFILSGYDKFDYVRNAFMLGVDDYMLKPISISELDLKFNNHLFHLTKKEETSDISNTEITSKNEMIVNEIKDIVQKNINRKVSLKEFSNNSQYSYNYLSKVFKDTTGISFSSYVNSIKMETACDYLEDPFVRINEISKKLGYDDPNRFSRAFKNTYGCYPTEY